MRRYRRSSAIFWRDRLQEPALIKDYIRRFGLSQAEAAKRLGLSPSMLSRILSGERNVGLKSYKAIEKGIDAEIRRSMKEH